MVGGGQRNWNRAAAIITGAGSGVGRATAKLFAGAGARLLLAGRNENKLRECCGFVGGAETAFFLAGDVGDVDFCRALLAKAESLFGRLDVLVNNAGTIYRAPTTQTPDQAWTETMRTNLDAVFYLGRGAMARMQQQRDGAIVNIASTVGLVGAPNLAAYCASKGGVAQLTRAMALDCAAAGVTVNAVCPGAIDTPMLFSARPPNTPSEKIRAQNAAAIPQGRLATAEEVARAVMFLASEPHITGVMLPVDGGYTAQ